MFQRSEWPEESLTLLQEWACVASELEISGGRQPLPSNCSARITPAERGLRFLSLRGGGKRV